MNYLAHLFLSGSDRNLLIGNFIADAVKGNKLLLYPKEIQKGIRLHRFIDDFTDKHAIVRQTTARLRSNFGKFSPVVADIYYDHFLAANWNEYHPQPLVNYTAEVYEILEQHTDLFPREVNIMLPYMIRYNWLLNYANPEGVDRALQGLSRRTVEGSGMEHGARELLHNYEAYKADFLAFFPLMIAAVSDFLSSFEDRN